MWKYIILNHKFCNLLIAEDSEAICGIFFESDKLKKPNIEETPLLKNAVKQLTEYFDGKRKKFDLPLNPRGTGFQLRVWRALQKIPYGKTCCYSDIADAVKSPLACRSVGLANNRNPIPIIIPCHRVIGKNGNLTGYAGGMELKRKLLELERLSVPGLQASLD